MKHMKKNEIMMIHGTNYTAMTKQIMAAADFTGDYPNKKMHIGIKPNLVVAKPASSGATTHPEIVAGVIEFLQENGYENIEVLEGSWIGDMTSRAYAASGIGDVCRKYGVPCHDLQKDTSTSVNAGGIPMITCDVCAEEMAEKREQMKASAVKAGKVALKAGEIAIKVAPFAASIPGIKKIAPKIQKAAPVVEKAIKIVKK
jgi:uncharacterized protein (DUF362 family)